MKTTDASAAGAGASGTRVPAGGRVMRRFTEQEVAYIQQAVLLEIWDQAPALVFVADDQMRYVAVNATACETLGYTREEILSLRVTDVAVADDAGELYAEMIEVGENSGRTPIRAKDGTVYLLDYAAESCESAGATYYTAVGFAKPLGAANAAAGEVALSRDR